MKRHWSGGKITKNKTKMMSDIEMLEEIEALMDEYETKSLN